LHYNFGFMAEKHIQEVLTTAGLTPEQFKALKELPDDAADFKVDTYTAPISTAVETRVKNDPKFYETINKDRIPKEFLKTIESEQYGRVADQVRTKFLQGLNLTKEDFKDLVDEFKKLDVFAPAVLKKISEGKVTDKELQDALMKANTKIQDMEGNLPTLEKKYQDDANTKVDNRTFDLVSLSTLAQVPGLVASATHLAPALISMLRSKYDFKVGADGLEIQLLQKGKTLRAMDAKGTKELTFEDAVKEAAEANKWVAAKAKPTKENGSTEVNVDGNGELKISSHIANKIKSKIAADKSA
jgi:hypothetical protein